MSTSTLPSGQEHHFRERAFKGSFLVSFGVHIAIILVAGSMTLFRISGTNYAPTYTVDLVTLPSPTPAAVVKPSPSEVKAAPKPEPAKPEKKIPEPAPSPLPEKTLDEIKPSGGDEAARLERRQRIEELEMEARRLYESFTSEDSAGTPDNVPQTRTSPAGEPVTSDSTGGSDAPTNIKFRAYYDRIWSQIRSSWVIPEGVTSRVSLKAVVGIRIAPDGEIQQFWIEKRSGNDYYDQSALRAIRKANPLSPLPDEFGDAPLEVGINFNYPE